MTKTDEPTADYTVVLPDPVAEAIEKLFRYRSEGEIAGSQIVRELPMDHLPVQSKWLRRVGKNYVKLYHGRFEWAAVGFSYVETGSHLHIASAWRDREHSRRRAGNEVDTVLPEPDLASYLDFDFSEGVSIFTLGE